MKLKIAILGSTGSIGKTLIDILKKDKKNFIIELLSANKNYDELLKQAKIFNVKNLIITDKISYFKILKINKNKKIRIFNNYEIFHKVFNKKIDYTMSAISGLEGLEPTLKIIQYTKKIAIANKEGIICGWNLLNKNLLKYKTEFLPVDSEHFSIWYALKNNYSNIHKILLTASGGPFHKLPLNRFKKIKINQALKHPNWKMGKKISIDSATMMNKVFEIIEAKNIFNLNYKKLSILIHPKSYVHAIVTFEDGMTKIIVHDTNMKIPIFNTLYSNTKKKIEFKKLNIKILNNLSFESVDRKKFPIVEILDFLPLKSSLFETVIVSANDELVRLFLNNDIDFIDIQKKLLKLVKLNQFKKLKKIKPKNIRDIINLDKYVRFKINSKSI
jgi:1-deoxy-D-xylulose-5-phosphate reductoisomerase